VVDPGVVLSPVEQAARERGVLISSGS